MTNELYIFFKNILTQSKSVALLSQWGFSGRSANTCLVSIVDLWLQMVQVYQTHHKGIEDRWQLCKLKLLVVKVYFFIFSFFGCYTAYVFLNTISVIVPFQYTPITSMFN